MGCMGCMGCMECLDSVWTVFGWCLDGVWTAFWQVETRTDLLQEVHTDRRVEIRTDLVLAVLSDHRVVRHIDLQTKTTSVHLQHKDFRVLEVEDTSNLLEVRCGENHLDLVTEALHSNNIPSLV